MPLPLLPEIATQSRASVEKLTSRKATTAPPSKERVTSSNRIKGAEAVIVEKPFGGDRLAAEHLGRYVDVAIVAIEKRLRFITKRENHAAAVDYDIYSPERSGAA